MFQKMERSQVFTKQRLLLSDVAQWLACRAHRHLPPPGGSSIETRRRYFFLFLVGVALGESWVIRYVEPKA
jgi:hypothetical protein